MGLLNPSASRWGYSGNPAGFQPPLQVKLDKRKLWRLCYLLCDKLLSKY